MPRELQYKYYKMAKCSDVPSDYKRFTTGNGENLPCVGCYQLPFRVTLLVVTRYSKCCLDKTEDHTSDMDGP